MQWNGAYRRWLETHRELAGLLGASGTVALFTVLMRLVFGPLWLADMKYAPTNWPAALGMSLANLGALFAIPAAAFLLRWRASFVPAATATTLLVVALAFAGNAMRGIDSPAALLLLSMIAAPFGLLLISVSWRSLPRRQEHGSRPV